MFEFLSMCCNLPKNQRSGNFNDSHTHTHTHTTQSKKYIHAEETLTMHVGAAVAAIDRLMSMMAVMAIAYTI